MQEPEVGIRRATIDDLDRIVTLEQEAFGARGYPAFVVRQFWDASPRGLLVATVNGDLAGYVLVVAPAGNTTGWVLSVVVDSHSRGQSWGRRLLEAGVAVLKELGMQRMLVTADPDNSAVRTLYTRVGFHPETTLHDYLGPGEDRLLMSRAS
jgi:[ribosomal protein S18]-alanine N-acetyltransferase